METKLKNPFVVNGHAVTKELLIRYVTYLPKPVPVRHHFSTLPTTTNQSNSDPEKNWFSSNTILTKLLIAFLFLWVPTSGNGLLSWWPHAYARISWESTRMENKRGRRRSNNIHSQHALSTRQLGIPFSGVFVPSGPWDDAYLCKRSLASVSLLKAKTRRRSALTFQSRLRLTIMLCVCSVALPET